MPRPKCCRNIGVMPENTHFKPAGLDARVCDEVFLTLDEFEAIRLAFHEGLYQEQAALMMNVSRPTFGRIIESAQFKIADFLVNGKHLKITGGDIFVVSSNLNPCENCKRAHEPCEKNSSTCTFCRKSKKPSKGENNENCTTIKEQQDR